MKIKNAVLALAFGIFITACENDDSNDSPKMPMADYMDGILISNEGPFNNGTGTVSFISQDLEVVENNIYNKVNGENLGNIVQSIGFAEDYAYIVANVSNTITVVDRYTFEKTSVISEGLNNPRYFLLANGKGYVTNWGDPNDETDDFVALINLQTNSVEGTIPVDFGPEEISLGANTIYIAHQGGFGQNNKISVIDMETDTVSSTIDVGDVPNAMQFDTSGNLWVLSGGKPSYTGGETAGSLSEISTQTNTVVATWEFSMTEHPNHLAFDNGKLYYSLNGAIYSMATTADELPGQSDFDNVSSYVMTVQEGRLYVTDAKDFASQGSMTIFDIGTKSQLKTFDVGIIPGGIYFN